MAISRATDPPAHIDRNGSRLALLRIWGGSASFLLATEWNRIAHGLALAFRPRNHSRHLPRTLLSRWRASAHALGVRRWPATSKTLGARNLRIDFRDRRLCLRGKAGPAGRSQRLVGHQ